MTRAEEHQDEILRLYTELGNGGKVAKALKITNYRVYKCLRANDIELRKDGTWAQKHSAEKMVGMYESGMSTTEIAEKLDMNAVSVWERLKNNGVELRTKSEACEARGHTLIPSDLEQRVVNLYMTGSSSREIADGFGLKYKDAVLRVLKKHEVKIRDMYGPNNHAWKGGRLRLNKMIRNCSKYIKFRDQVLRDRDYTCEVTGQRGGKLNVHHIFRLSNLIDQFVIAVGHEVINDESRRDELYALVEGCDRFWDPANVMVVTEEAHKQIHTDGWHDGGE